jgi:hypothetical protein
MYCFQTEKIKNVRLDFSHDIILIILTATSVFLTLMLNITKENISHPNRVYYLQCSRFSLSPCFIIFIFLISFLGTLVMLAFAFSTFQRSQFQHLASNQVILNASMWGTLNTFHILLVLFFGTSDSVQ